MIQWQPTQMDKAKLQSKTQKGILTIKNKCTKDTKLLFCSATKMTADLQDIMLNTKTVTTRSVLFKF